MKKTFNCKLVIFNILIFVSILSLLFPLEGFAKDENILNVYAWSSYLYPDIIAEFTRETHIRVNISEYDSNETMYAKLKASPRSGYDVIIPSSYFIQRMQSQNMLHKLDKNEIPNIKYINPKLLHQNFDPQNDYSLPLLFAATGIVVNSDYIDPKSVRTWQDLWQSRFHNQLLVLDDIREVFSIAMITLGYSVNDTNPEHIKQAYLKLKQLLPNVKIFNSDIEQNIYIDEDAIVGMGWNGDINLSIEENPKLKFIFPEDGFVLSIDCLAITKNAPHLENAEKFINFLLRPDIAARISLETGFSSPNLGAIKLLPKTKQMDPVFNPPANILKRSQLQTDVDSVLPLYEKYWEKLKIGA